MKERYTIYIYIHWIHRPDALVSCAVMPMARLLPKVQCSDAAFPALLAL